MTYLIKGNSYAHRASIKAAGGRFVNGAWYIDSISDEKREALTRGGCRFSEVDAVPARVPTAYELGAAQALLPTWRYTHKRTGKVDEHSQFGSVVATFRAPFYWVSPPNPFGKNELSEPEARQAALDAPIGTVIETEGGIYERTA